MDVIERIETKRDEDIKIVDSKYKKNKEKVIDFLFNSILQVEIRVPDVVKGNFEERFNMTKN